MTAAHRRRNMARRPVRHLRRGKAELEQQARQTVLREAGEELGLNLKSLEHVAGAWASPGVSTEFLDLYLAPYSLADRISPGGGLASEHEKISVVEMPIAAAWELMKRQELMDLKTLALLMLLRCHHPELFSFKNGA